MGDCTVLTDHLGSAQVGGAASGVQRYSAFGEVRSRGGELPTAYQYTGQLSQMEQVGLYHYGARWFDPAGARFTQADTLVPENQGMQAWDRYAYVNNNPVNAVDPTGHAMKLDDDGNSRECPANTCYIVLVGSIPALHYYPISPINLGDNAANTSAGGGSMDAGVNTLPDIVDKNFTAQVTTFREPSGWVGIMGFGSDMLAQLRNELVEIEPKKITAFAFYKKENHATNIKSLDIHNPTGAGITAVRVGFTSSQGNYDVEAGPSIRPKEGYYGIPPVIQPGTTTTVSLVPSGYRENLTNSFSIVNVGIIVWLVQTDTGMAFKLIQGIVR